MGTSKKEIEARSAELWRDLFVVGQPGVGKTTIALRLADLLGVAQINSGDALRDHLRRNAVDVDEAVNTGTAFLSSFGEDTAGAVILSAAERMGARVVDGVRLFSTLSYFEAHGRIVDVLYVQAAESVRRVRFAARSILDGEASPSTVDSLLARKEAWDADLALFAERSRWQFDNSGAPDRLHSFAVQVAAEIRRG